MKVIELKSTKDITWKTKVSWFTILLISTFLPFYIGMATFLVTTVFLLIKRDLKFSRLEMTPNKITFIFFIVYSLIISMIHMNTLGFWVSLAFIFYFLFFSYYQKNVRPDYLEIILSITLYISFFLFVYAVLEYFKVIGEWDYSFLSPIFEKNHQERVEVTFYNPNYYALMLEFFILIGLYKINRKNKKHQKILYGLITLCNLFAVYFTGTRSTPVVFVSTVIIFYLLLGKIKKGLIASGILGTLFVLLIISGNYPRAENLGWALRDRFYIWETALKGIRDNFFFGQGPLTYRNIYELYGGQETYHAHNIILDTLLSYGIIGTSLLIYPFSWFLKRLWKLKNNEKLRNQFALFGSLIAVVVIHGMVDLGIFWFQTSFLFLFIVLFVPNLLKSTEPKR